jgi:hypothetical protein
LDSVTLLFGEAGGAQGILYDHAPDGLESDSDMLSSKGCCCDLGFDAHCLRQAM